MHNPLTGWRWGIDMMQYRLEPLSHLLNSGLADLGNRSWDQIGEDRDIFEYDPNWQRYAQAERNNDMRIMAMRDENENLVGYATIFVTEHLVDKKIVSAYIQDFYIEPEARKGYKTFHDFMDEIRKMLKLVGVKYLTIGERENDPRGSVGNVYRRYGFHSYERLWNIPIEGER